MTESDWQHKGDRENMRKWTDNTRETMTQSDWQHKIETTRVTEKGWEKGLTEQESMTESDWQHKIETTKVTENESGKRTDKTRINDTEWLTTQD